MSFCWFCHEAAHICKDEVLRNILPFITQRYIDQWTANINRENACSGNGQMVGINFDFIERLSRTLMLEHIAKQYLIDRIVELWLNFGVVLPQLQSKPDAITDKM